MGHAHAISMTPRPRLDGASGEVFAGARETGVSDVHFRYDPATELRAVIAIHSTRRGPAVGGCRCLAYPSEASAVDDAMRLARAMSHKAAISRLPCGGGKAVLMRPAVLRDRQAYFESFGAFVDQLGGRFVTAVDSGTSVSDMDAVARRTRHVGSTSGPDGTGDPSPYTALGVRRGIQAAVTAAMGRKGLEDVHVLIQGTGAVGRHLARELRALGARLTVCDVDAGAAHACGEDCGAAIVSPEQAYDQRCDVFSPCALGDVINPETVQRLDCQVIAGSANNPLASAEMGERLHRRGILYAPDFVINAGGLIQLVLHGRPELHERIAAIHDTLVEVFQRARWSDRAPSAVAWEMAEELLRSAPARGD